MGPLVILAVEYTGPLIIIAWFSNGATDTSCMLNYGVLIFASFAVILKLNLSKFE